MSTGTALVHPSTAKLTPGEQAKGTYVYTPPEVLGYLNGDTLSDADMVIVTKFFNGNPPALQTPQPDQVESFNYQPQITPKRLVKRFKEVTPTPDMLDAVMLVTDALSDADGYTLLVHLAKRYKLEIE